MENLKELLNITPIEYKNIVKIDATWDYYNDDYDECHAIFDADEFFKDKKLIWSLAYLEKFGKHVERNDYIDFDTLFDIVDRYGLWEFGEDDSAHSLEELEITYYDENKNQFKVTFDDIHKRWETMTEEEICKEVNELIKINKNED